MSAPITSSPEAAQAAWIAYRDEYRRANFLSARQMASQVRRREFIAGYLAGQAAKSAADVEEGA